MAEHLKYSERIDSIVTERATRWGNGIDCPANWDRRAVGEFLHHSPSLAGQLHYDRTPTGFCRVITVTEADVARYGESLHSQ